MYLDSFCSPIRRDEQWFGANVYATFMPLSMLNQLVLQHRWEYSPWYLHKLYYYFRLHASSQMNWFMLAGGTDPAQTTAFGSGVCSGFRKLGQQCRAQGVWCLGVWRMLMGLEINSPGLWKGAYLFHPQGWQAERFSLCSFGKVECNQITDYVTGVREVTEPCILGCQSKMWRLLLIG